MLGNRFRKLIQRTKNASLATLFVVSQVGAAAVPFINPQIASALPVCTVDTAGANDEPGQKDLTRMCFDNAGLPTSVNATWNWDDVSWPGGNTGDACALFDTDGDGNANYATCVTVGGGPAVQQANSPRIYTCNDSRTDRCAGDSLVAGPYLSTCSVSQQATQPFGAGDGTPNDTVANCTIRLAEVGGGDAQLIDVCSFPSQQPNSDPSDCVVAQPSSGKVEVRKNLIPNNDSGLFNLSVDGPGSNNTVTVNNQGHNGTTGEVIVDAGVTAVGETAGTNTSLASYSSSIVCRDLNGTGAIIAQGNATTLNLNVAVDADVVCIITNTAAGSITIIKDAVPNDAQDFAFAATGTGTADFALDNDADATLAHTKTFNNLGAGTYTFTEADTAGWYLDGIDCPNITETQDLTTRNVSLTIAAGQNITCTFTNRKLGQIIVTKQTQPDGDSTQFSIAASPSSGVVGSANQTIADNETETYVVRHGTYGVTETVPAGWTETSNNCSNLVIDGNTPLVNGIPTRSCTINNTKLASLRIIKDALPNDAQDFVFTTFGAGLSDFSLDDDADITLSNEKLFTNLLPGQYSVTEQSTPGWSLTGLVCDNQAVAGSTASISLLAGQEVTCTFTNTKLGSLSGIKYTANADGGLGPVLGGWTIFIDSNNNGTLDNNEVSDITELDGSYSFTDLLPGSYTLKEVLQAGWTQIFGPATVDLDAGEVLTDNNFGNFENATIQGFKWNDRNANDVVDQGEEQLDGWTITLFNDGPDGDTDLDDFVSSTVTANGGTYSFSNLAPGTYAICETQQAGWTQTYPDDNGCHTIVINISGETEQANFGNQGRGNITVIKNVDTDGDGTVDIQGSTDWTWDIAGGAQNTATGSSQNVAAGIYTVSEDQMPNYHVVSVVCDTQVNAVSESAQVIVAPGANVTCTFTNARDTGTITVRKIVNPTNDTGLFNLQIDGQTAGTGANVGHGGGTGTIQVPTGTHTVSEIAGTNTNLADYTSSFSCSNNLSGNGTTTDSFIVNTGDDITCTFTNTRLGRIIVEKQTDPDGAAETFEFDTSYDFSNFALSDGQQNDSGNLQPGIYSVTELSESGWDLTSAVCSDQSSPDTIDLSAGETVTCVFTNTQDANIIIEKQTDPNGDSQTFDFTTDYNQNGFSLSDGQQNDSGDLEPGTYSVSENALAGWELTDVTCSDGSDPNSIDLSAGETVTCVFNNQKDARIIVIKQTNPVGSNEQFAFTASYDANGFTLGDGQQNDSGDLDPGTYSVSETVPANWDQTSAICDDDSDPANISLSAGEVVTCTFTNVQRGSITVVKDATPNDAQDFHFEIDSLVPLLNASDEDFDLDDDQDITLDNSKIVSVRPGSYTITESQLASWDLDDIECGNANVVRNGNSITVNVTAGDDITCTFVNIKRANVVVLKFNDRNQNGLQDANEEALSNWEMTLNGAKQLTDQNGVTSFANVIPDQKYTVGETQQTGWSLTGISCIGSQTAVATLINTNLDIFPAAGETVTCKVGNFKSIPAVLGTQTLVNTGQSDVIRSMIAGITLLVLGLLTVLVPTRKTVTLSGVISFRRLGQDK